MGKVELQNSLNVLDVWLIIFGLLVAVGAVGGSVAGFLHWRRGGQLQTVLEAENLVLQNDVMQANARALEAQVALEKFRTPRTLTVEQQNKISAKLRILSGVQFDAAVIRNDAEAYCLLDAIAAALTAAGWTQVDWISNGSVLKRQANATWASGPQQM
jgi:hypothetical protein